MTVAPASRSGVNYGKNCPPRIRISLQGCSFKAENERELTVIKT
jgi:hypothetical protein